MREGSCGDVSRLLTGESYRLEASFFGVSRVALGHCHCIENMYLSMY
jgi:hypothetical protein